MWSAVTAWRLGMLSVSQHRDLCVWKGQMAGEERDVLGLARPFRKLSAVTPPLGSEAHVDLEGWCPGVLGLLPVSLRAPWGELTSASPRFFSSQTYVFAAWTRRWHFMTRCIPLILKFNFPQTVIAF